MSYFKSFKKIDYDFQIGNKVETHSITNIGLRTVVKGAIRSKTTAFYKYVWRDGDRPDIIADKYYGSHKYWWVVFFSNNSFDLYYDFPLTREQLDEHLDKKYKQEAIDGGFASGSLYARNTVQEVRDEDDNIIVRGDISEIDSVIGADFNPQGLHEVTIYDAADEENEAKREINLIDNRVLQRFVAEYQPKMNERRG